MTGANSDDRVEGEQRFAAARLGDPAARDAFLVWLRPWVVRDVQARMYRRLKRWVDPEDVVQEVLWKSVQEMGRLPTEARLDDFLPWVRLTATRRIHDERRKHRRKLGDSVVPERGQLLAADQGTSGEVTQGDERRWLRRLIAELPDSYGEVVRLIALEGLDVAVAAQKLLLPKGTVRKRYDRARQALRRRRPQRQGGEGT